MPPAAPLTGELLVNTITTSFQRWPAIAVRRRWRDFVRGLDLADTDVWADVQASVSTPPANRLGGEFRVNAMTPGPQHSPAVAADADGTFVVAWTASGPGEDWHGRLGQPVRPVRQRRAGVEFRVEPYRSTTSSARPRSPFERAAATSSWPGPRTDGR